MNSQILQFVSKFRGSLRLFDFHITNDLHQCLKMVRLLFGFSDLFKNRGSGLFTG